MQHLVVQISPNSRRDGRSIGMFFFLGLERNTATIGNQGHAVCRAAIVHVKEKVWNDATV